MFTILDMEGRNIASVMSGQQGLARFHDLRPGAYRIMETVSPPGHIAPPPMELTIGNQGAAFIDGQPISGMYDVRGQQV